MIIGAQLYSVRDTCTSPEGIRNTFKAMKEIGYKSVQVSGFTYDARLTREAADEYGLHIGLTHTGIPDIINDVDAVIEKHKILGADVVGIGYPGGYTDGTTVDIERLIKDLKPYTDAIYGAGLKFAYHNHALEYNKASSGDIPMNILFNETNWNFTFDTGWADYAGSNVVEDIKKYADRLEYVHLKDFKSVIGENGEAKKEITPIYTGTVPCDDIIAELIKAGTKVAYVEQDNAPSFGDSWAQMKISYDNISAKGWIK